MHLRIPKGVCTPQVGRSRSPYRLIALILNTKDVQKNRVLWSVKNIKLYTNIFQKLKYLSVRDNDDDVLKILFKKEPKITQDQWPIL